ncbi:MAG: sulfotransferase, partial [Pseudomonadota bacterium]|nr:sulfotransferase [Pseudomonadota bacterium]
MNEKFLIILSPPRSFSSVVSTVIGQHPDLYGFPELHLFIGDTVQEVIDVEYGKANYFGPPGVLR